MATHRSGQYDNYRAEASYQHTRERERQISTVISCVLPLRNAEISSLNG